MNRLLCIGRNGMWPVNADSQGHGEVTDKRSRSSWVRRSYLRFAM